MKQPLGMGTPAFTERRDRSEEAVLEVARWARRTITPNVRILAPPAGGSTFEGQHEHDDGDLLILGMRCEVKWRLGLRFDNMHFPFKTCFLCAVHQWDQADPKPYAFMIVNHDLSGFLLFRMTADLRLRMESRRVYNNVEQRWNDLLEVGWHHGEYHAL